MSNTVIHLLLAVERGELSQQRAITIVKDLLHRYKLNTADTNMLMICKRELETTDDGLST